MRSRPLAFAALAVLATPACAAPLAGPTMFKILPYLDGQSGAATDAGPEQLPVLASGYTDQLSNMLIEPVGDGSVVHVEVFVNLRTNDVTTIPTARHSYMLIAGLPPLDTYYATSGFAGHFEGVQFRPGGQVSLSGTPALNDTNGSRWYLTVSYPNALPVNCEWVVDTNPHLVNPCWLSGKTTDSGSRTFNETPARFRGTLSYLTSWALVAPWLVAQEIAGKVTPSNDPSLPSDRP